MQVATWAGAKQILNPNDGNKKRWRRRGCGKSEGRAQFSAADGQCYAEVLRGMTFEASKKLAQSFISARRFSSFWPRW